MLGVGGGYNVKYVFTEKHLGKGWTLREQALPKSGQHGGRGKSVIGRENSMCKGPEGEWAGDESIRHTGAVRGEKDSLLLET